MKCHACRTAMVADRFGHWCHNGPCPGYPVPWTSDRMPCPYCGHDVLVKSMPNHHHKCSADNPQPPHVGKNLCRVCSLWHRPMCPPLAATWPLEPLLEHVWTRTPERTYKAAAVEMGMDDTNVHRYLVAGLSDEQADRWACRVGIHPSLVWPAWFDAVNDPLLDVLMAGGWRAAWLHNEPREIPEQEKAA